MENIVNLKNIFVFYGKKKILNNISFKISHGKIITILGPNGSGKSTLARVILGLILPSHGKLIKHKKLRMSYVPQKIFFDINIPITVEKFMNLNSFFKKNNVHKFLQKVNAEHLLKKSIHNLSGGEIQKVLLARSLLNKPHLIVLDEPTQGLDINGQNILYDLITKIHGILSCSIIIISHDLHIVMAKTDEVICLNRSILCYGTPKKISDHPSFIEMFGCYNEKKRAIYKHNH
ncbi:yebM [Wigglesworthia glossinidia endosymbiont of Glossina brevipalpis]|uniref:Zinc import ATP-binding protein ZnuC n=1 Tax=Wigglesworthia glossinidia brevipalpis TaxID=36870 RepID=ZNUC_WIGBR|nr:RecName: Full=Zinc import ATP-binding protein ZnuC [Wigglesworthia glossinidia endosymbiont of Glossina brevipalpis]BAC24262.1 yebM [Wigglesworthia glossinidia endosymbiont of Glossina brevipalpis]